MGHRSKAYPNGFPNGFQPALEHQFYAIFFDEHEEPISNPVRNRPAAPAVNPVPQHFQAELQEIGDMMGWECAVCTEPLRADRFHLTPCFHKVCTVCIARLTDARCPICREPL